MSSCKYIVLFPVPEPFKSDLVALMDKISRLTGVDAPYAKLCPHVTFHRPIEGIDEDVIVNLTKSIALQTRQTRVTVSHLFNFGKQYIVLPVHATRRTASFWIGLNDILSKLPEYEHGQHDHDNTLHITVAEKISGVFDQTWPIIRNFPVEEMNIPMQSIELHRKIGTDGWEMIDHFPLPV